MVRSAKKKTPEPSPRRFNPLAPVLFLVAGVAAVFINFPPGDSWTHGWTVDQWLMGNFVLNDWSSAVALPQQVLGWLVNLGAENVQWWRLSLLTAIVTVAAILIAADLPRKLFPDWTNIGKWTPLFAIVILATPFALKIGAGFMTDGYYFLLLTGSLWILIDLTTRPTEHTDSQWFMKWGLYGLLAIAAALQRSHGFFLLLIPTLWILFAKVFDRDPVRREGWSTPRTAHAFMVCVLGLIVGLLILMVPSLSPARSGEVTKEVALFWTGRLMPYPELAYDRFKLVFGIIEHLGLALLPIALLARRQRSSDEQKLKRKPINWWYVIGATVLVAFVFKFMMSVAQVFPYLGNSVTEEGFGPRSATIALTSGAEMDNSIRLVLTFFATLGGVYLIWLLSRTVRLTGINWRAPSTLIGLIGLAHLGIVFLNPHFFDRYLLPIMPFCFIWLAPLLKDAKPGARLTGWVIAVLLLAWSVYGTYDALNWTKAKWDIAAELRADGIPSSQIVGGYEVDGFYNYTNENYPGMEFGDDPMLPWWVDRLGLEISPDFIVTEIGAMPEGPSFINYQPSEFENSRMMVWYNSTRFEE